MPRAVIKIEDDEPAGERVPVDGGGRERDDDERRERDRAIWAALEGLVRCLEALVDPAEPARKRRRA